MAKQILRRTYEPEAAVALQDLHPLLQRIYATRKVQSIKELDRALQSLVSYQTLLNINAAAVLIGNAITKQQKFLIVGDFDADGATSTAIAVRALRSFGVKHVEFLVPNRFAFGYGLTPELVTVAKDSAADVIITVDNGIANHAGVLAAKSLGMQVVITDHHLPAATLPAADVIVNPNQVGDLFPSKNLAGCGVIFYVMLAVRRYLADDVKWFADKAIPEPNMSKLLDLVALGTVADLVQLDQNNRILVHQGLRRIRAGQCIPGIIALLELSDRHFSRAVAADLGFVVAARLNAAGRMDDMTIGIECLLTDDSIRARELASTLDQLNDTRRHIEKDMQTQAMSILKNLHSTMKDEMPRGICLFDSSWHQGVIGILAARIKDRLHRPTIIFAPAQHDEIKGSARSIAGVHIRDLLALIDAQHPHLIRKFGGHAMAAGLTIAQHDFHEFTHIFQSTLAAQVTDEQLQHLLMSDGALQANEYSLEVASMLRESGPWGQAFPEPLFDDTFRILEQRIVGDKHLKLRLQKDNNVLDAVAFFVDTTRWPNHRSQFLHAAFHLDVNEYKNRCHVQLIIDYLEPVEVD